MAAPTWVHLVVGKKKCFINIEPSMTVGDVLSKEIEESFVVEKIMGYTCQENYHKDIGSIEIPPDMPGSALLNFIL